MMLRRVGFYNGELVLVGEGEIHRWLESSGEWVVAQSTSASPDRWAELREQLAAGVIGKTLHTLVRSQLGKSSDSFADRRREAR